MEMEVSRGLGRPGCCLLAHAARFEDRCGSVVDDVLTSPDPPRTLSVLIMAKCKPLR